MGKKYKKNSNHNYNQKNSSKKVVSNNNGQINSKNQNVKKKKSQNSNIKNKQVKNISNTNIQNSNNKVKLQQNSIKQSLETKIDVNKNNPNADLTETISIKANQNDSMVISNYELDKKLALDEDKKKDIGTIYDRYQTNLSSKNSYGWKILSLVLFLIIIGLIIGLVIIKNEPKNLECVNPNMPNDNQEDPIDNDNNIKKETYLFLGDSIFWQYKTDEFFKDYNIINSGTNGITALETLNVIEENVYKYNPTTIFVLLGTNDLYHGYNSEETLEHLKNLIDKIHSDKPEIKINILSLLPINKTDDPKIVKEANNNKTNEQINEINEQIKKYCDEKNFTYINVHDVLVDDNGDLKLAYTNEGLHITDLGYHQITMQLLKYIEK